MISLIYKKKKKLISNENGPCCTFWSTYVQRNSCIFLTGTQQMAIVFNVTPLRRYGHSFLVVCSFFAIMFQWFGGTVELSTVQHITTDHCSCKKKKKQTILFPSIFYPYRFLPVRPLPALQCTATTCLGSAVSQSWTSSQNNWICSKFGGLWSWNGYIATLCWIGTKNKYKYCHQIDKLLFVVLLTEWNFWTSYRRSEHKL